jgi:hypothetical protein
VLVCHRDGSALMEILGYEVLGCMIEGRNYCDGRLYNTVFCILSHLDDWYRLLPLEDEY